MKTFALQMDDSIWPPLLAFGVAFVALLHLVVLLFYRTVQLTPEPGAEGSVKGIAKSCAEPLKSSSRPTDSAAIASTPAEAVPLGGSGLALQQEGKAPEAGLDEAPGTPGRESRQWTATDEQVRCSLCDTTQPAKRAPNITYVSKRRFYLENLQSSLHMQNAGVAAWSQQHHKQHPPQSAHQRQQALPRLRLGSLPPRCYQSPSGNLKQPRGLASCVISEDMPYPPANAEVTLEVRSTTVRHGRKLLRYWASSPLDTIYIKIPNTSPSQLERPLLDSLRHTIDMGHQRIVVGAGLRPGCTLISLDVMELLMRQQQQPPPLLASAAATATATATVSIAGPAGRLAEGAVRSGGDEAAAGDEAGWGPAAGVQSAEGGGGAASFPAGGLAALTGQLGMWLEAVGARVAGGMQLHLQYGNEVVHAVYDEGRVAWSLSNVASSSGGGSGGDGVRQPAVKLTLARQVLVAPAAADEAVQIAVRAHGLPGASSGVDAERYTFAVRGLGRHLPVLAVAAPMTPVNSGLFGGDSVESAYGDTDLNSADSAADAVQAVMPNIHSAMRGGEGLECSAFAGATPAPPSAFPFELTVGGLGGSASLGPLRLQLELWYDNSRMLASKSLLLLPPHEAALAEVLQSLVSQQVWEERRELVAAEAVGAGADGDASEGHASSSADALISDLGTWLEFTHDWGREAAAATAVVVAGAGEEAEAAPEQAAASSHSRQPDTPAAAAAAAAAVILPGSVDLTSEVLAARRRDPAFASSMLGVGLGLLDAAVGLGCCPLAERLMADFAVLGYSVTEVWRALGGTGPSLLHAAASACDVATLRAVAAWAEVAGVAEDDAGADDGDGGSGGGPWCQCDDEGLTPLHILALSCFSGGDGLVASGLGDTSAAAALEWALSYSAAARQAWVAARDAAGATPQQLLGTLLSAQQQRWRLGGDSPVAVTAAATAAHMDAAGRAGGLPGGGGLDSDGEVACWWRRLTALLVDPKLLRNPELLEPGAGAGEQGGAHGRKPELPPLCPEGHCMVHANGTALSLADAATATGSAVPAAGYPGRGPAGLQRWRQRLAAYASLLHATLFGFPTAENPTDTPYSSCAPPLPVPSKQHPHQHPQHHHLPPPPHPHQPSSPGCASLESDYQAFLSLRTQGTARGWVALHLLLLGSAVRRLLAEGRAADCTTAAAYSAAYGAMAVVMHVWPGRRFYLRHRGLLWAAAGFVRVSCKSAQLLGWLPVPPATLLFVRRGVTLLPDALLPALCEPCPLPAALLLALYDLLASAAFYLRIGFTASLPRALLMAFLKAALSVGVRLAMDAGHRAAFLRARVAPAAIAGTRDTADLKGAVGGGGGRGGGGGGMAGAAGTVAAPGVAAGVAAAWERVVARVVGQRVRGGVKEHWE